MAANSRLDTFSRDPAEDDQNLYRYAENNPINYVDPAGSAKRSVDDYGVQGTGHHIIPVELWKEFGFDPETYKMLDNYRTIKADTHNFLGHGKKTGYTGFLRSELRERLAQRLKNIPDGKLSVIEQQVFIKQFIDDVHAGKVKRKYIYDFNKAAAGGTENVRIWRDANRRKYPEFADDVAPIAIRGLRSISASRVARLLGFLGESAQFVGKKYLPLVGAISTYHAARANGNSPIEAAAIAGLEEVNPVPYGYEEIHAAGVAYETAVEGAMSLNRTRTEQLLRIVNGGEIPGTAHGRPGEPWRSR